MYRSDRSSAMPEERQKEYHQHRRRFSFLPAGFLLGLGVGLLIGYPGPGLLIGLGIGFIASAFMPLVNREVAGRRVSAVRWGWVLAGVILILIGLWLAYIPFLDWPYLVGILLILIGIWSLARAFMRMR
jgi:xanthine/uracil permease